MYLICVAIIIAFAIVPKANILPAYNFYVWDKNQVGGLLISSSVQCSPCAWYYSNGHGISKRVSNDTVLHLNQESVYDEYYLLDDQRQSVEEYALVVPNSNAGSPFESDFLILTVCRTGINHAEFHFIININERAITSTQPCDLRWNGLPECSFGDGTCPYNGSHPMDRYSVRCRLATEKENYISSIPTVFGPVDDLPLCPSAGMSSITVSPMPTPTATMDTTMTPLATISTPNYTTSTTATSQISISSTVSTTSTATPDTLPNHSSSVNTQETNAPATPATTSSKHTILISVICVVTAVVIVAVLTMLILIKVCLCNKHVKDESNPKAKTSIKSQLGCIAEVIRNLTCPHHRSNCSHNNFDV